MASYRKRGDSWEVQVRIKGQRPLSTSFRTKAQAQEWARRQEDEMRSGMWRDLSAAQRVSVSNILEKYRLHITPRKKSATREESRIRIITASLGDVSAAALTPERIVGFVDKRLKTVGSDTVRKELNTLGHALKTAMVLWGVHLRENPVTVARDILSVTRTLEQGKSRERRVSDAEINAICAASESEELPLIIRWALLTGMRRGEIVAMRREHLKGKMIVIPDPKTGKGRERDQIIPLSSVALKLWKKLPKRDDGRVFTMTPDAISHAFARAALRAKVAGVRFHDLRHEATSRFFERGMSIQEVATITRHADWRTLKRYTHLDPKAVATRLG